MYKIKIVIIILVFLLLFCSFGCGTDFNNAVQERDKNEIVVNDEIKITVKNETGAVFTAWADGAVGVKTFYLKQGETLIISAILYDSYKRKLRER